MSDEVTLENRGRGPWLVRMGLFVLAMGSGLGLLAFSIIPLVSKGWQDEGWGSLLFFIFVSMIFVLPAVFLTIYGWRLKKEVSEPALRVVVGVWSVLVYLMIMGRSSESESLGWFPEGIGEFVSEVLVFFGVLACYLVATCKLWNYLSGDRKRIRHFISRQVVGLALFMVVMASMDLAAYFEGTWVGDFGGVVMIAVALVIYKVACFWIPDPSDRLPDLPPRRGIPGSEG